MKRLLFLLFLVPAIAWGQLPARKELRDFKKEYRELKKEFDVVLDPISQIPAEVYPDSYEAQESGNWGNQALETDKFYQEIAKRATRRVHVYVFDTGGKWAHEALKLVEQPGAVFTGEPDSADGNGHGTHCAGIIGGVTSWPLGVARGLIEKELLNIYPVKVLSNAGAGNYSWITNAVLWANERGKQHIQAGDFVIYSMSLGGSSSSTSLTAALVEASRIGVLTVAASGNTGGKGVNFPGASQGVRAIAALQNTKPLTRASFSTTGPEVWAAYPGQSILSAYKGNTYATLSGTSMATPHAAAIAAIAASVHASYNAGQIVTLLEKVSTDLDPAGRDENTGYGVALAGAILAYQGGTPVPDPNPEPPKPVEPVKPERVQAFTFSDPFTVTWGRQGSNDFQKISFRLSVTWKTTYIAPTAKKKIQEAIARHFTNRGYYLRPDDDEADCLYWIAYFAEMILKKEGTPVEVSFISDTVNPVLTLTDPIAGRINAKASYRARVVTFEVQ
jgi:subtilisin family serine protease